MRSATRRAYGQGALAVIAIVSVAVVTLLATGTGMIAVAATTGYLVLGILLPGTVLVRLVLGKRHGFLADVSVGAAAGYGVEVFAYCAARWAGHPRAVMCWPVLVVGVSLLWPRLRRRVWSRTGTAERTPSGLLWGLTGMCVIAVIFLGAAGFVSTPLTGPGAATPYVDMPFHLSLVGEMRHHMPPNTPYVAGESLDYHWFVYAHLAAVNWVTGVEPVVLLTRTELVPFTVLTVLLIGVLGRRISGSSTGGILAAVLAALGGPALAQRWDVNPYGAVSLFNRWLWHSPTQTYAMVLMSAALVVAVTALAPVTQAAREDGSVRPPPRFPAGPAVLLALLVAAAAGAKATVLPLVGAGFGLALLAALVRRRWAAAGFSAIGLGLTVVGFGMSLWILFGGQAQGMAIRPLRTVQQLALAAELGLRPGHTIPSGALPLLALLCVIGWLGVAAGTLGLGRRLLDPDVALLTGTGIAAVAAALATVQPGTSQLYFLRTAMPTLAVVSAAGLTRLARPTRPTEQRATARAAGALIVGLTAGAALGTLIMVVGPARPTLAGDRLGGWWSAGTAAAGWYAALALALGTAVALAALGARAVRSAHPRVPPATTILAAGLAAVTALGLPVTAADGMRSLSSARPGAVEAPADVLIPAGGINAARWLRDHSGPADLVATNSHCRDPRHLPGSPGCDNRNFWLAAFSERRVLVEGWGYTSKANAPYQLDMRFSVFTARYWDRSRLAANDAAFARPSATSVDLLRTRYGVRWLVVDRRVGAGSPDLGRWARLAYVDGQCAVYAL